MKAFFAILVSLFSIQVMAGDAGCGLGSVVIQRNSKVLQLFAMTTNQSFFTQPLGITSGTSGCSASGIVQNDKEIDYFVEINHDELSVEMAQGQGEKLSALAMLNGCESEEQQKVFGQWTQKSFEKIVPTSKVSGAEMASNLKKELNESSEVAQACWSDITSL
jgi:hypothetical protein